MMIKDLRKDGLNLVEGWDIISYLEDLNIILGSTTKIVEVQKITKNGDEIEKDFVSKRVTEFSGYETFEEKGSVPTFKTGDVVAISYFIGEDRNGERKGDVETYEFLVVPEDSTMYEEDETEEEYEERMKKLKILYTPTTKDIYVSVDKEITFGMLKSIEKKAHSLGLDVESLAIKTKRKIKIRLYGANIKAKIFNLEESIFKVVIQ